MKKIFCAMLMSLCLVAGCASAKDDWSNINYEKIARDNQRLENDPNYTQPISVTACVDDDLYNCSPKRRY